MSKSKKEYLDLLANLESQAKSQSKPKDYFDWVVDYWTARGEHLEFIKHKYLVQIYKDQHPHIVFTKSAQVGLTERFITEAIWLPDQYKENSIYFMPTSGMVSDLVQERIDEPINANQYLREVSGRAKRILGKQADKMGMKKMSKGFSYFRGSNKANQIITVSGDVFFADEIDRMLIENLPFFDKRLQHSNRKWQRWGSTPTIPNFGIHKMYLESDQTECWLKCLHCGEKQVLTFWDNVDEEKKQLICKKCKQEVIPWKCDFEWIAANPSSDIRGYHISQLYSPRLDLNRLIKDSKKTAEWEVQQFYNQGLGLPYEPKGAKITEELLSACKRDYTMPLKEGESFAGIDVGKILHIVIINKSKLLYAGTVQEFSEIDALIKEYNCKGFVVDALPETRKSQELTERFKGRGYICYYSGLSEVKENEWFKTSEQKVNTDRTLSLDVSFAKIREQEIEMPKNLDDYTELKEQLKSLTRVVTKDRGGNPKASYVQIGEDHYAHAYNYATIAKSIFDKVTEPEVFLI